MEECVSLLFLPHLLKNNNEKKKKNSKASIEHFSLFQYCSFNKLKTSFHERRKCKNKI